MTAKTSGQRCEGLYENTSCLQPRLRYNAAVFGRLGSTDGQPTKRGVCNAGAGMNRVKKTVKSWMIA